MPSSYFLLAAGGLLIAYILSSLRSLRANVQAAKQSGLPYIVLPVWTFNRFWLVTHRLWLPLIRLLPDAWTREWIDFVVPEYAWARQFEPFRQIGSDAFLLVAPGHTTLLVADAEAVSQITTRRNDFPKPTHIYRSVDIYGKNVVSTEGAYWRHHRKITSPPFTEKNNHLVWRESLQQAQSMMTGWMGKDKLDSGPLTDVSSQTMRLSLHVISRAGFGVSLEWPHEEKHSLVPEGHTLSYKIALERTLENIIPIMLTPRLLLRWSPFQLHKTAYEAYIEWGKYMREMYDTKRHEVQAGETREGMDLMGALVKGAGINTDPGKTPSPTNQLLTDDEILGNAFVFILAGHETAANTLHFSTLYLALHPHSQRHLQRDLDLHLGDRPPQEWDYDTDLPALFGSMPGAVMNEELRLIPPVVGIPKQTLPASPQGLTVAGKHVTVPPDTMVTLNTTALHRNPKNWPHTSEADLLDFRPERWLLDPSTTTHPSAPDQEADAPDAEGPDTRPDTAASLYRPPKGAYVPFSDGYRSCLGRRFAQVEILAVLAVMFKSYTVELDVSAYLSDAEFEKASQETKKAAWEKAAARARELLKTGMGTIITIQMRGEKVPLRFVRRGEERFGFM